MAQGSFRRCFKQRTRSAPCRPHLQFRLCYGEQHQASQQHKRPPSVAAHTVRLPEHPERCHGLVDGNVLLADGHKCRRTPGSLSVAAAAARPTDAACRFARRVMCGGACSLVLVKLRVRNCVCCCILCLSDGCAGVAWLALLGDCRTNVGAASLMGLAVQFKKHAACMALPPPPCCTGWHCTHNRQGVTAAG